MSDEGFSVGEGADDALLRELGDMLRTADPVPPHLRDGAHALLTWRTVDDALARLLGGATAAARSAPAN